jgi:hypothetical protein
MWKEIWRLQVPNYVKMFMWRACKNILPTRENLFKRKVLEDTICMFYSQGIESTRHVLWDCPAAMDVWGVCDQKFHKAQFQGSEFRDVWEALIQCCNGEELAFSAILARNIWHRRNSVVHGRGEGGLFSSSYSRTGGQICHPIVFAGEECCCRT